MRNESWAGKEAKGFTFHGRLATPPGIVHTPPGTDGFILPNPQVMGVKLVMWEQFSDAKMIRRGVLLLGVANGY